MRNSKMFQLCIVNLVAFILLNRSGGKGSITGLLKKSKSDSSNLNQ